MLGVVSDIICTRRCVRPQKSSGEIMYAKASKVAYGSGGRSVALASRRLRGFVVTDVAKRASVE